VIRHDKLAFRNPPRQLGRSGNFVGFSKSLTPSPLILNLECTKNAIHPGHFGTTGKSVQKIFLVIVFYFFDPTANRESVQNLLLGRRAVGQARRARQHVTLGLLSYYWPLMADHIEVT